MKDKPDPNLPPHSQPWARAEEAEQNEQNQRLDLVEQGVQLAASGGGGQADINARLLYELRKLYQATGVVYPPVDAVEPVDPPDLPPEPVYTTVEVGANWSRTWGSSSYYTGTSGEYVNGTYLYQGSSPEAKIGLVGFDVGPALNKNIVEAYLFLANKDSAYSFYFTAGLGTHAYSSPPVGKPGRENGFDVGWARGEAKWHPLPSWIYGGLSNGTIKGFSVGGIGPSDANSAWFYGDGYGNEPRLRIKYQV